MGQRTRPVSPRAPRKRTSSRSIFDRGDDAEEMDESWLNGGTGAMDDEDGLAPTSRRSPVRVQTSPRSPVSGRRMGAGRRRMGAGRGNRD